MFTRWLTACGFTRDWAGWLWLRLVSAAMIADGLTADELTSLAHYAGIPASTVTIHRVMLAAVAILWMAGKQAHSGLPSKAELESVKVPTGA